MAGDYIKKGTFFRWPLRLFVLAQAAIQHLKDIAETFGSQWTVEHLLLRLRGLWDSHHSDFLPVWPCGSRMSDGKTELHYAPILDLYYLT